MTTAQKMVTLNDYNLAFKMIPLVSLVNPVSDPCHDAAWRDTQLRVSWY